MTSGQTRRDFLGTTGALASYAVLAPKAWSQGSRKPRVAALASTYYYLSHAYHIVGRFLDGFPLHDGHGPHRPDFEIASLYIEQVAETDLGRDKAKKHGVRLSPTIEDALALGTGKLAVDAVLLIAEHGTYPYNEKLQKLYPRGKYFREVTRVFRESNRVAPVFIDKHLSYDRPEARAMYDTARAMGIPLMAGSSLPVTWRLPALEIPLGRPWEGAIVASRGDLEIFGFHALETLQCMVERRDRLGKPQGVKAVTCLEKDDVWKAGDAGVWSWELLYQALSRSHTLNPGDIKKNTLDFRASHEEYSKTKMPYPVAFVVEYIDGFRATALILNGHVDDTTFAGKIGGTTPGVASTLVYLPAPPGANFFNPLVLRIEDFFHAGQPPYPIERTLLTGGILDAALTSRVNGHARVETPDLAAISYDPPADSGFIRTPIASAANNPF